MPTAMTYAIDTILRLCEENTRLKCGLPPTALDTEEIVLVVNEKNEKKKNVKFGDWNDETWSTLQNIDTKVIKQYLAEECCFHIYDKPPPTVEEVEALKVSADLIAEAQQKQINLMIDDKRERMDDRERLLKRIDTLEEALIESGYGDECCQLPTPPIKIGAVVKGPKGRPPKCSPCMGDPQLVYEASSGPLHQ
jgi:hypothetical protein